MVENEKHKSQSRKIKNNYSFRNAQKDDIGEMIGVIGDYYNFLERDNAPLDKSKAPWSWISDSALTFRVLLIDGKICGFFIARHIHKNTHLHSFFVKEGYRNKGLGEILLAEHWINAINNNSNMETLTLHMHTENTSAVGFYLKHGYQKITQSPLLFQENNGFGCWASNCKEKDQWPLREGIDLYGFVIKDNHKIILK
jgi:ribosomal protein S18 acetylase RimI-like enzyme